jgi:prolyl-tRNA synthetase
MGKSYEAMFKAYTRIFDRCGIPYVAVEADSGMMGGAGSHEFMVPTDIGEDRIVICEKCGYSASTEVAPAVNSISRRKNEPARIEVVDTPGVTSVEDVSRTLNAGQDDIIKTMIYAADEEAVAVLVRGDHEVNEVKLKNYLKAVSLDLADKKKIREVTGGPAGFSGPVGLEGVKLIADLSVENMVNAVAGANEEDKHIKNVNPGRDFFPAEYVDLRNVTDKDPCPKCSGKIELKYAIEVGHTFKLGKKYSEKLGAAVLDKEGKQKTLIMGCYGIGVNRILASRIETEHDKFI